MICLIRSQLDYLHLLTSRHQHRQDHQEGGAPRDPGARGLRDEGGGEVAKLPNLQLPALSLLSDQDGGLGVGPQEPGLVPLLPTPGELVDVITDHQSPEQKSIHSFKYVNDACLKSPLQPIKPK